MGYSITQETHDKIEANRREGRLCKGGNRHCTAKATRVVSMRSWNYKIDEGTERHDTMIFCGRHAKDYTPGFRGVNFIVTAITKLAGGKA